jgi:hypothetical protein
MPAAAAGIRKIRKNYGLECLSSNRCRGQGFDDKHFFDEKVFLFFAIKAATYEPTNHPN